MPPEIIDSATFAAFFDSLGGEVDFLSELVEAYLTSSPGLITSIHEAIAAGDASTLQRAAHTLKSGSASFGALAFAAQCKELEDIGKAGALAGAEGKARNLDADYHGVVTALLARMQTARPAAP